MTGIMEIIYMTNVTRKPYRIAVVLITFLLLQLLSTTFTQSADNGDRLRMVSETTFKDEATGKMWQFDRSKRIMEPNEAIDVMTALNSGEYHDWRFPTKQELFEFFQVFDLKNNGSVKPKLEGNYWLRDDDGAIQVGSWEIGDGCGPGRKFFVGKAGYVRAIRP
jgi:hypothetical protein